MKVKLAISGRRCAVALAVAASALAPRILPAQSPAADSSAKPMTHADSVRSARRRFYQRFAEGFVGSILLHESGHFAASYAMGFHPRLGFDKYRPTVFSGIIESTNKHKQFLFSAAGLTVQDVLNEMILDIPHSRGGPFERGLLSGGIGTTLFYITIGRNARVSDISVMARTSTMSKGELSMIFGSVSAIQAVRIGHNGQYAHFFAAPTDRGGIRAGVSIRPD